MERVVTVALAVILIMGPAPDHHWWIWTCVTGIVLGLFGCGYVWRRDRRVAARAGAPGGGRRDEDESVPGHTPS